MRLSKMQSQGVSILRAIMVVSFLVGSSPQPSATEYLRPSILRVSNTQYLFKQGQSKINYFYPYNLLLSFCTYIQKRLKKASHEERGPTATMVWEAQPSGKGIWTRTEVLANSPIRSPVREAILDLLIFPEFKCKHVKLVYHPGNPQNC